MDNLTVSKLTQEERDIFEEVDSIISRAVTIGDPLLALEYGARLKRRQTVEGLALAKLLYRLQQSWGMFRETEEELIEMVDIHMDVRPTTTKKYLDLWEKVFENPMVPDDVKEILSGRPIGELLLLTAAVGEGQLTGKDLKDAALSPGKDGIRQYVQKARGKQTSANSAVVICMNMMDKPNMAAGTLYAKQGSKRVVLGVLDEPEDGPELELWNRAVTRLKNAAGIVEVWP